MKINKNNFSHTADMVKLNFSKKEEKQLIDDLNKTFEFIDTMNLLDTENIEPMDYIHSMKNVFREDVVLNADTNEQLLSNAPDFQDEYYVVPKTIK